VLVRAAQLTNNSIWGQRHRALAVSLYLISIVALIALTMTVLSGSPGRQAGSPLLPSAPVVKAPKRSVHRATIKTSPSKPGPSGQALSATSSSVALRLPTNIAPSPDFLASGGGTVTNGVLSFPNPCVVNGAWPVESSTPTCTAYVLAAINNAHTIEGIEPMVLPSNYDSLSVPEQLFVVANLERVDRGLAPYVGLNQSLDSEAQTSANQDNDPDMAPNFSAALNSAGDYAMGGAWGGGYSVLGVDYIWMYADGWAGAGQTGNVDCTSAGASACWAHRGELLGDAPGFDASVGLACDTCMMGTGYSVVGGGASYVDLIEKPLGTLPATTFTWSANVVPYLTPTTAQATLTVSAAA
jgi:hypothetical protein